MQAHLPLFFLLSNIIKQPQSLPSLFQLPSSQQRNQNQRSLGSPTLIMRGKVCSFPSDKKKKSEHFKLLMRFSSVSDSFFVKKSETYDPPTTLSTFGGKSTWVGE
ncbi:MAG: hypothetical protein ACFN4U_02100 [Candidatus Absconditicoccaceae bacterium]